MFNFKSALKSKEITQVKKLFQNNNPIQVMGLNSLTTGAVIGCVCERGIIVSKDLVSSSKLAEMLSAFGYNIKFLTTPFENNLKLIDNNIKDDFMQILQDFAKEKVDFIIAMPEVLFQKVPTVETLINSSFKLNVNDNLELSTLSQKLVELGYQKVDYISSRGEFSVKGDTVLVFPLNCENLIRLEFFDTQLEKISEVLFEERKLKNNLNSFDFYARELPISNKNILSLSENVIFDEPKQIEEHIANFEDGENFVDKKNVLKTLKNQKTLAFSNIIAKTFFNYQEIIRFSIEQSKSYLYSYKELLQDLSYYKNANKQVFMFCKNEKNKELLQNFLEDNFVFTKTISGNEANIHLLTDFLPHTINIVGTNSVLIGTYDLFKKDNTNNAKRNKKLFIPKINDFVVHEKHGIGKCVGLEKLKISGYEKDYIIIEYFGGDKFYLPSEQADSLSLYSSSDDSPKLNKLGGVEFAKVKEKVYKNVKDLAFDLLKLYAKRENSKGIVYAKDDYLMQQFEDAFEYNETPDQLRAIEDIKKDMESTKIMDRLVCGDVGYGKTEVALRAVYKAVISGKQVAILCPTTILSEQHFQTAQKRFHGFMVNVARFNRLISKKEENAVLKGLEDGTINVVCGTHKLLSDKVKFKNLSLLVLDEEQRFGVEDKEKIKNIKNNIDVLSLSATPIPRTLHMALSGIRDLSVIDTPPKERKPIQTFVTEFDEGLIEKACKQELARNGQVLIIYNRIDTIYDFAGKIRELLPNVSVGVAHGRLSQKSLEESILKLYSGEYQILVSTTLIENGINLSTANTLIVVDADKLGLSQSYQIRGRIGRSDKIAYAYFLFQQGKKLTDTAYHRLTALMENTALGSGYKIALADLDIRGAGNVLGKEQHGNLVKVGYDLYYKLLNVALKDIKGEKEGEIREVKFDIDLDCYIPETYIQDKDERLKVITKISDIENEKMAEELKESLFFTYGKVPQEVENIILLALLKVFAQKNGVKRILINANTATIFYYDDKPALEVAKFGSILEKIKETFKALNK